MKKMMIISLLLMVATVQASAEFKLNPHYFKTQNGTEVVFVNAPEVPMLEVKLAFKAGSAYDEDAFGLSALTTELMNQGNDGLSAAEVADRLADTGAQFQSGSTKDMAVFELKTLSDPKALNPSVKIFTTILTKPDFTQQSFEREKNQQLIAIKQATESPSEVANHTFFKVLYQDHPYAHPVLGVEETVKNIQRQDVVNFYNSLLVAQNATMVMVGAIDLAQAKQIANQVTANLTKGQAAKPLPKARPLNEAIDSVVPFPSSQTVIRLGELGVNHHNRDFFPLLVGNYILGGGALVSQLATEVREKRGLTYGVYSQFLPLPATGPFVVSLSTENSQADEAVDVTLKTIKNFVNQGPSDQALKEAKQYLIGSFPLSLASNGSIADILLKMSFYNLPKNYLDTYLDNIESTTTTGIKKAFQKNLSPNQLIKVMVGKQ